jgi:ADP-heptose:LPS heptosyltransferase
MNLQLQKTIFELTSSLTQYAPNKGARFLDHTVHALIQNPATKASFRRKNLSTLRKAGALRRVLILCDIHLGDAVMLQGFPTAIRDYFPKAETHYVVSRSAAPFVMDHPDISHLHALYQGKPLPSKEDHQKVRDLIRGGGFDLILNACPFLTPGQPLPRSGPVLDFLTHAPRLVENEVHPTQPNHFLYQSHRFLADLLGEFNPPQRGSFIRGARIFLTDADFDAAEGFLENLHWEKGRPVVLLNPDTASPFTKPPEDFCATLLARWTAQRIHVLVGEGHSDPGMGQRLISSLPLHLRTQAALVPSALPATTYAALTDMVDAFVSGDTGPLHWAAARKISRTHHRNFSNRTSVFCLFGATAPSMSGYDSKAAGFLPAWQDAESRTFISTPPCRNLTCMNKLYKTCVPPRCFEGLHASTVAQEILVILSERSIHHETPRTLLTTR